MTTMQNSIRFWSRVCLLVLMCTALVACADVLGVTPTPIPPTPSMTATCISNISLVPPTSEPIVPKFIVVLFDPNSSNREPLEYSDGTATTDIVEFIYTVLPRLMKNEDQASVFRLGASTYEDARSGGGRWFSDAPTPQPIPATPTAYETLPIPATLPPAVGDDMNRIPTERVYTETVVAYSATATVLAYQGDCANTGWQESYGSIESTQRAAIEGAQSTLGVEVQTTMQVYQTAKTTEVFYRDDSLHDGLLYATRDFQEYCGASEPVYEECLLIIFDDLVVPGTIHGYPIDLTGIKILNVMGNCRDINQPSCARWQQWWGEEFAYFGAADTDISYVNGERLEGKILEFLVQQGE